MIVQKEFLGKLRDFGLNTYESKLWTALLSRGVSTAGELSDIANVPRSRSYDVLESLEKKGFIIMKTGKPIKYLAVPPEEVVERVKKKVKESAEDRLGIIDGLKTSKILSELSLLHNQGIELIDPFELSGSLRDRNNIYNHLETMLKGAKKSVVLTTTADGIVRKSKLLKQMLPKLKQKGVKVKIATQSTKDSAEAIKELSKLAEIKHTSTKARFCIIDNKELLFMLLDDDKIHPSYDLGIWVNTEFFANALQSAFESEWERMKAV